MTNCEKGDSKGTNTYKETPVYLGKNKKAKLLNKTMWLY